MEQEHIGNKGKIKLMNFKGFLEILNKNEDFQGSKFAFEKIKDFQDGLFSCRQLQICIEIWSKRNSLQIIYNELSLMSLLKMYLWLRRTILFSPSCPI